MKFLPKFRQASVLVHFHSFSCVATFTSSITKGTHPPNTYILQSKKQHIKLASNNQLHVSPKVHINGGLTIVPIHFPTPSVHNK